jgi:hypothetical protein
MALPANIRLGSDFSTGTNALAYSSEGEKYRDKALAYSSEGEK